VAEVDRRAVLLVLVAAGRRMGLLKLKAERRLLCRTRTTRRRDGTLKEEAMGREMGKEGWPAHRPGRACLQAHRQDGAHPVVVGLAAGILKGKMKVSAAQVGTLREKVTSKGKMKVSLVQIGIVRETVREMMR